MRDEPLDASLDIPNGPAVLEVCIGEHDSSLLVDGQPSVIVWEVPSRADTHYVLRAFDTLSIELELADLTALRRGLAAGRPLAEQLGPLLRLFGGGRYRVVVLPEMGMTQPEGEPNAPTKGTSTLEEWLGLHEVPTADAPLVGTIPREMLDDQRIDEMAGDIRAGSRPLVVFATAEDANAAFLVHGHHALEAYRLAGRAPAALCLVRGNPRRLSMEESVALTRSAFDRCTRLGAPSTSTPRAVTAG